MKLLLPLLLAALPLDAAVEDACDGASCSASPAASAMETALCPVGEGSVPMLQMAPRLNSLAGKTIAIVGGSFMAHITHPELRRLILSEYPDARVILLSEIGSAGPWPGPGVQSPRLRDFENALREKKVQAVISGNGGCGLCTPKEMGSCIAAEHLGIPSVMIAGTGFVRQAQETALTAGVPAPRVVEYPGAFASQTREQLIRHTRSVLWPGIKKALTEPIAPAEVEQYATWTETGGGGKEVTGAPEAISRAFSELGWSDGLPIVPPTEERVAEFLRFSAVPADEVVAEPPPARRRVTARLVAINGVMSGCPPEYMPILIAFTRAMENGAFRRTLASTHSWNPYCWLNGPVARQLGISDGQGEISAPANARIGRFMNLALQNLAGYYIGKNRMGTFGYLMPWCLAENESAACEMGWQPYHVQMGFGLNENTLTAASALSWGNNMAPATADPLRLMELLAWDATEKQQFALGSGTPHVYRTFLMTPPVARVLAEKYRSKDALEEAIVSHALMPLDQRAAANYYANPGSVVRASLPQHTKRIAEAEQAAERPTPFWLAWSGRERLRSVPVMQRGKSAFLITGDPSRNKAMCLPGGGAATIRISLPERWDDLVAPLGYAPLKSFYLPVRSWPK